MPRYPSTISLTDARGYYGPSREDPRSQPRVWSNRPPSGFYEESHPASTMAIGSLAVGSAFASGFIKVGDRRLWDYYVSGIRGIEEYSPGGIFRTFQDSTFFSQFTSPARQGFSVGGEFLRSQEGRGYARYLSTLIGDQPGIHSRILKEGVTLKGGSLFFGETGDLALKYAGAFISPTSAQITSSGGISTFVAGKHLGSGYARSMGFSTEAKFGLAAGDARLFGEVIKGGNAHKIPEQFHRQIIGSHSALGYVGRQFGAAGTELVSRFNRLLEAPFEMQPFKTVFGGAQNVLEHLTGKRIQLAVKYGSGSEMLGRLALKYGVAAGALGIGYKSLDYLFRQSEYLNDTFLDEGLTAGLASIWTKANVLVSQAAETTGLHTYREAQEEIAPGSTDLSRLIAFPLIGGLSASGAAYGVHVAKMAKMQYASIKETGHMLDALSAATARVRAQEELTEFGTKGLMGRIGKIFGDKSYPFIGKMGPVKLAGLIGAGIGATLAAPFLPGALIPSTRPDELKRIYSGEQEVAIRKGRWWEFGRTPWEGQRVMYYRPHWYPRMLQRSKETSIWGDKPPTPLEQWWRKEFTYDLEKEFYNERPYPISSLPFEDIPLIGPVLANTIGRLIKPPVLMHTEEWLGSEGEQLAMAPGFGERMATELGQLPPGTAESPFNITGTVGEQAYRLTEMVGLPGFAMTSLKEAITGSPDLFDQSMRLESARRAFGIERSYWDLEIGGGLGTCFIAGTKITTKNGLKNIENICIGDLVLTHGKWKPVIDLIRKKPKEQLLRIQSSSAGVDFTCTANHWIPILRRHRYDNGHVKPWKEENYSVLEIQAKNIQEGDFLFYEINPEHQLHVIDLKDTGKSYTGEFVYSQASKEFATAWEILEKYPNLSRKDLREKKIPDLIAKEALKQFRQNKTPKRVRRHIFVSEDIAYFIGWYLAKGCTDGIKLTFTMHKNEINYAQKLQEIAKKIEFNSSINIDNNTLRLNIYSSQLAKYFQLFGKSAHDKHIPKEFKDLPNIILVQLVQGLVLGNGWIKGFTSVSKQLVKDLFDCRLKLGQPSYLTLDYTEKGKDNYPQETSRKDCTRNYLEFRTDKLDWRFIGSSYLVPVTSIDISSDSPNFVYDLTVKDLHHYTAEGVRVHNTEALRRLYPHRRRQINLYNPIRNTAPEWLTGPGERAPDFLHGDPYCISSDTLVEALGHGFMRVDKLRESDWIKSHKGRWLPVKKIIRREMNPNEQLFEIKVTSLAAFPIKASEEHPLWTPEGWIEVKDLKEGDYVGYPIPELDDLIVLDGDKLLDLSLYCDLPFNDNHIFVQGSQEYADCVQYIESTQSSFKRGELKLLLEAKGWNRKTFENAQRGVKTNNINRIPRYINPRCAEWGLLSGYYAAEGSSTNGSICFAFNKHEVQYHNEVISSLKYLFNIEGKIYPASQGEGVSLIVTNKALAQIFPRIFGQNSYSKRLPLWVGSFIPALAALFNGDGSFFFDNDKPRLSLSSKSKKLLWEIRQFLLVFGYVGSIVEDNLIYRGQAAKDCAQFISTSKYRECPDSSRTVRHTYIQDGYVWMRIFSKREVPQEPVYGIEVDYDDSFCVVGVATHNTKVQEGELRLPGRGYEARFPELKGLSPEEYPDIHKYKILADVAPYSDKFKLIQQSIRSQRKLDSWSEYEENIWTTTEAQLKERKIKRRFAEYQYLTPTGTLGDKNYYADESKGLLTELNKIKASQQPETGVFARVFGGYWEALAHNAETAMDVLTPISPAAKLIHQRTAIEDYANSQVYGTENAFWSHPMRDFIRPFLTKVGVAMGFGAIPEHIKRRRDLEEYFDILEYTKYTRLSNMARMAGDVDAMKEFESKKNETMFGLNPFTYNFSHIFRALPRRERDYFNAFAAAETVEERAKILNMVPENEKALYIARWKLQLRQDIQEAEKAGLLSEDQIEEADSILTDIDNEAKAEGFPNSKELFAEYLSTKLPGENYGDWYRRTQLLPDIPLPGDSWVGWHPSVDLEDVKLKVVQAMGEDMHDYDLWPTRAQALLDKPFINESAVAPLFSPDQLSPREMQDRIQSILLPIGVQAQIFHKTSAELEIDMEQDVDIESFVNRLF